MKALIAESRRAIWSRQRSVTAADVIARVCSERDSYATVCGASAGMLGWRVRRLAAQIEIPVRGAQRDRRLGEAFEQWPQCREITPVGVFQCILEPLCNRHRHS